VNCAVTSFLKMNSESDSGAEILGTLKRKKGVINYDKYKQNIIKIDGQHITKKHYLVMPHTGKM